MAAGVLTVTLLFAAMLGINRLFVAEREQGGFDAFLLAPVDRSALLVAKATALPDTHVVPGGRRSIPPEIQSALTQAKSFLGVVNG